MAGTLHRFHGSRKNFCERLDTHPPICDHLPMVTETIWEGHLIGIFEGYAYDRLYALSDDSNWRQACETREYVYRERPAARLVRDRSTGRIYLDVAGTSASVLVARDRRVSRQGSSAF